MKFYNQIIKSIILLLIFLFPFDRSSRPLLAQETGEEETYSISLVQTAEVDKEIVEVEGKRVLTETYTVARGDWIWQLFRERGLLKKRNLQDLIAMLKTLNKDLKDLNLIHPNQKIIIPLIITPLGKRPKLAEQIPEMPTEPEALKEIPLENYTIARGDTLIKVIRNRYQIPEERLYTEYLKMVRELNPSIQDLDVVYPGQVVRLPIWTPQVVRAPIERKTPPQPEAVLKKAQLNTLSYQLGQIFTQMGEEWIQSGDHFIPLRSGGHINLRADSFPVVNLFNGYKVIVDLYHTMPEKMRALIETSWENYRIVRLNEDDDLRTAFDRILPASQYAKTYRLGEPVQLPGMIPLQITGDWIIQPTENDKRMIMITLVDHHTPRTPQTIKDFLRNLGIKAIDYPPSDEPTGPSTGKPEVLRSGTDLSSLVQTILSLNGTRFSRDVEIPIYRSGEKDFSLVMKADFFFKVDGKDAVIDMTGLEPDIVALLREHQFLVLVLAGENDPSKILSRTLDLLGVRFDAQPHDFMAAERDEQKNIRLTIPGILFQGKGGQNILATPLEIPEEIALFLSQKGYNILSLSLS